MRKFQNKHKEKVLPTNEEDRSAEVVDTGCCRCYSFPWIQREVWQIHRTEMYLMVLNRKSFSWHWKSLRNILGLNISYIIPLFFSNGLCWRQKIDLGVPFSINTNSGSVTTNVSISDRSVFGCPVNLVEASIPSAITIEGMVIIFSNWQSLLHTRWI